jgi:hypothetical protein
MLTRQIKVGLLLAAIALLGARGGDAYAGLRARSQKSAAQRAQRAEEVRWRGVLDALKRVDSPAQRGRIKGSRVLARSKTTFNPNIVAHTHLQELTIASAVGMTGEWAGMALAPLWNSEIRDPWVQERKLIELRTDGLYEVRRRWYDPKHSARGLTIEERKVAFNWRRNPFTTTRLNPDEYPTLTSEDILLPSPEQEP